MERKALSLAHERGLSAAIRLALGGVLLIPAACGSSPKAAEAPTGPAVRGEACASPSAAPSEPPPKAKPRSCREVLASVRQAPRCSNQPDEVRCCEEASKHLVNYAEFVNESGCCGVEFPSVGPTCTPWGPPVPPQMPAGWV